MVYIIIDQSKKLLANRLAEALQRQHIPVRVIDRIARNLDDLRLVARHGAVESAVVVVTDKRGKTVARLPRIPQIAEVTRWIPES